MSKRQYLELMGIDVWQKRLPRQATPRPEKIESATEATAVSGHHALADVRASLQQHDEVKVVASPEAPAVVHEIARPDVVEVAPEFFLAFSHFNGLTMVTVYPGGFAAIPGNHHRFLNTLYFALTQKKQNSEISEFRWPMVKSDRISQSKADAQKVLGRHLGQCQAEVLVFGQESADLLSVASLELHSEQHFKDRRITLVEETEVYFRDPLKRRTLWQFLGPLKKRLAQ